MGNVSAAADDELMVIRSGVQTHRLLSLAAVRRGVMKSVVVVMSRVHWTVMRRVQTILGGRPVPCGIPRPIGAVKGAGWHKSRGERWPAREARKWRYTPTGGPRYNIG